MQIYTSTNGVTWNILTQLQINENITGVNIPDMKYLNGNYYAK